MRHNWIIFNKYCKQVKNDSKRLTKIRQSMFSLLTKNIPSWTILSKEEKLQLANRLYCELERHDRCVFGKRPNYKNIYQQIESSWKAVSSLCTHKTFCSEPEWTKQIVMTKVTQSTTMVSGKIPEERRILEFIPPLSTDIPVELQIPPTEHWTLGECAISCHKMLPLLREAQTTHECIQYITPYVIEAIQDNKVLLMKSTDSFSSSESNCLTHMIILIETTYGNFICDPLSPKGQPTISCCIYRYDDYFENHYFPQLYTYSKTPQRISTNKAITVYAYPPDTRNPNLAEIKKNKYGKIVDGQLFYTRGNGIIGNCEHVCYKNIHPIQHFIVLITKTVKQTDGSTNTTFLYYDPIYQPLSIEYLQTPEGWNESSSPTQEEAESTWIRNCLSYGLKWSEVFPNIPLSVFFDPTSVYEWKCKEFYPQDFQWTGFYLKDKKDRPKQWQELTITNAFKFLHPHQKTSSFSEMCPISVVSMDTIEHSK